MLHFPANVSPQPCFMHFSPVRLVKSIELTMILVDSGLIPGHVLPVGGQGH